MDGLAAFEALKACLVRAPILGFPTEGGRFVLDTDASLFAVGGVLSQLQNEREVVIAYASHNLRLSRRRYCTTHREMLAAVVMCTHFQSYLRGAQFTLRTDHSYLRWLHRFRNGMSRLGCLVNVASVCVLTARCRRWIRRFRTLNRRQRWWISLSPRRRWASRWMPTYCRSCPVKLG